MSEIIIIAAMAKNHVIGVDNRLPWHLPDDLKHFKQLTLNKAIIMGRKTWESLPGLLPNRRHIVITRNPDYVVQGAETVSSLEQAIELVAPDQPAFIVGGGNVYQQAIQLADKMYLTIVDSEVEGDAFFPNWDESLWHEVNREFHPADEKHNYDFAFVEYEKISSGAGQNT